MESTLHTQTPKAVPLVIDVYTKFRPTEGAERSLLGLTSTGGMAQPLRACENRMGRADRGHSYQPAAGRRAQVGADRDHLLRVALAGVITLMANALWRGLRKDHQEEQFRERALSRRMREFVDQTLPI
ncbi:hypothetical protein [Paracidovorax citrulli]|uniref:hypothetical protein n=1 Tax=Paracidovorax citrulli TaxID=80869 RepID=UPI003FA6BA94